VHHVICFTHPPPVPAWRWTSLQHNTHMKMTPASPVMPLWLLRKADAQIMLPRLWWHASRL
jgi:hypothetical protein